MTEEAKKRRIQRRAQQRRLIDKLAQPAFEAKVAQYLDQIIDEGLPWQEAAKACKLTQADASQLWALPRYNREFRERLYAVRLNEMARNLHLAIKIRDQGFEPDASAAQKRVAIEAMEFIEGRHLRKSGFTINVPTGVSAGLVINLNGQSEEPRQINRATEHAIKHEPDEE